MYLFGIKDNHFGCGNEYTMIVHYTSEKNRQECAANFKKMFKHDEVYKSEIYTQKMCEMSDKEFVDYIRNHAIRVA